MNLYLMACAQVLLVLLLGPLFEGIMRKLVAVVHSRIGPPLHQPYLDILKLLGKEELVTSPHALFRYSAVLGLAAVLTTAVLIPVGMLPPLESAGDILVFIYLITLAAVMVVISGISSDSPYGFIGASREVMMLLTVEPVILIALITMAVKAGSTRFGDMMAWQAGHEPALSTVLAGITLFVAIIAQLARLPFDIVEADQEIMEGPFIEQSGPKLALFKWMIYAKQFIFAAVFISVFLPWPVMGAAPLNLLFTLLKMIVLLVLVAVVHVVNPRLRIDQAVRFFLVLVVVELAGLALAVAGS
ncbi:MAG TPA: NADH-quinone oxidoreductase subunit H [bacterium]|nr:NADH-quinone oxidoreductase subunit H [bacterium]HPR88133.1 NADH-quinone oxidoreductase subunit H [bacterium]